MDKLKEWGRVALAALSGNDTVLRWSVPFVLVVALVVGAWWHLHTVQSYGEAIGKADTLVQMYERDKKALDEQLKASQEKRDDISQQQQKLDKRIQERTRAAQKKVAEVTSPDRTPEQTQSDVAEYFGFTPKLNGAAFELNQKQVQSTVQFKIERDAFESTLNDTKKLYLDEQEKNRLLTVDLDKAKEQIAADGDTIQVLNKAIRKTKKQKIWDGVQKGLAVVGAAVVVREVVKR